MSVLGAHFTSLPSMHVKLFIQLDRKHLKLLIFLKSFFGMPAAPWYFGTLGRSCVLFFPSKELILSLLAGQCVPVFGCMALAIMSVHCLSTIAVRIYI